MTASQDDLLQQGMAAARAGRTGEARQFFVQVLQQDPRNETAWLWLSGVVETREDRIRCLQQVLTINPENQLAAKGLQALGALEAPQAAAVPGGVPLVPAQNIAQAQRQATEIIRAIEAQAESAPQVAWADPETLHAHPPRRRFSLYVSPLALAIGGSVALVIVAIVVASLLIGALRGRREAPQVSESGPVATPTLQLTRRPTRTPMPEGQPLTPEPSLPAGDAPRGDLRFGLTATPPYLATPHPASPRMNDAVEAYHDGRYEEVLDFVTRARNAGYDSVDSYYLEGWPTWATWTPRCPS
jgi:hypothetical protein